uniref:Uncharacterized protein n=1 Tax=Romanomermis culicivorax TaxID=13658 RepID=A0A915J9K8_ROMCU
MNEPTTGMTRLLKQPTTMATHSMMMNIREGEILPKSTPLTNEPKTPATWVNAVNMVIRTLMFFLSKILSHKYA